MNTSITKHFESFISFFKMSSIIDDHSDSFLNIAHEFNIELRDAIIFAAVVQRDHPNSFEEQLFNFRIFCKLLHEQDEWVLIRLNEWKDGLRETDPYLYYLVQSF